MRRKRFLRHPGWRDKPGSTIEAGGGRGSVNASTLTRISQGKRPDVDSLAALAAWSGLNVDRFIRGRSVKEDPEPLAIISSCIRSDPQLNSDAAVALDQMVKAAHRSMRNQ